MEVGFAIGLMIWSLWVALNEARNDANDIAANRPINHKQGLWCRIVLVGGVCLLFAIPIAWREGSLWPLVRLVGVSWASFTILFRVFLNSMRGLDWRYVSPSNWTDRLWMSIASGRIMINHGPWYRVFEPYRNRVNRAGTLAYCFEASVLIAAVATMIY